MRVNVDVVDPMSLVDDNLGKEIVYTSGRLPSVLPYNVGGLS